MLSAHQVTWTAPEMFEGELGATGKFAPTRTSVGVHRDGNAPLLNVSPKRLLDESPWLQFTRKCQRF
jgi:hypothetical protein